MTDATVNASSAAREPTAGASLLVDPDDAVVGIENLTARGPYVILVDHASNAIPHAYGTLGLSDADLLRHIAWDPGALPVARDLARRLDAVLIYSKVSRLIIDCNRQSGDPDLIVPFSEDTPVPGNADLSAAEIDHRLSAYHAPFHAAIEAVLGARAADGRPSALVAVHTFTPVYRSTPRPWDIGVLFDADDRLAQPVLTGLRMESGLIVGANQPYAPTDRVYTTLERHGRSRGLPCVMIEIRNDRVAQAADHQAWAERLARALPVVPDPEDLKTKNNKSEDGKTTS